MKTRLVSLNWVSILTFAAFLALKTVAIGQIVPDRAKAQYRLGCLYDEGESVGQDDSLAIAWYRLAAAQGHPLAQNKLGVRFQKGDGVPKDFIEAYKWFTLAAGSNHGNIYAVVNRRVLARRMTAEQIAAAELRVATSQARVESLADR